MKRYLGPAASPHPCACNLRLLCDAFWLMCQAAHLPAGSMERLLKVTGFIVSIYSCVYRPFAPFRSPAGETVELIAPDKGIRAIGEKV